MQLTNISELIGCDYETYTGLRDALTIRSQDFDHQTDIEVSESFRAAFPPTRAQEPLSGLWDHFDTTGMGPVWGTAYQQPGVDVVWHNSWAWVRAMNAEVSLAPMASIIRRVCEKYLPLIVSWNGANHDFGPGSVVGGCLKITKEDVVYGSTWEQIEAWQRKLPEALQAPRAQPSEADTDRLITRIRANAVRSYPRSTAGKIVIYIPEPLSPLERDKLYSDPLMLILKDHSHSCVEGGSSWLNTPGGSDKDLAGCEIVISSGNVESTCELLRTKLPGGKIPSGSQLQYRTDSGLRYDEWDGFDWRVRDQKCARRVMGKCVSERKAAQ